MKTRLHRITKAIEELKAAFGDENMKLKRILVDKTLDIKYELSTGKSVKDYPKVACDPFTTLCIADIVVVGQDNDYLRNHKEWPEGE